MKLGTRVLDWEKLATIATPVGERRDFFDSPTATLRNFEGHATTLNAGETPHAPHQHPDEELLIVKAGTVELTINGVAQRAGAGSVVFIAANDLHALRNVGDTRATYYVFRFVPSDLATK